MKKWNISVCRGAADGFIRGILLFLLGELVTAEFMTERFRICMWIACGFAIFVNVLFYIINRGTIKETLIAFGVGEVTFVLCVLLILLSYIELHFSIFPQRELWYGDGMDLLFAQGVYILLSGLLRLLTLVLKNVQKDCKA